MHVGSPQSVNISLLVVDSFVFVSMTVTVLMIHMVAVRRDEGVTSSCYGAQLRA